ncbi:hypothetical protein BOX37_13145 [Nocardia mangyaensis]|uniref:Uncharacterized protein n=2 Tax=Nocardia mangyaensis TaxID=2213200 RepID=A0A1J0VRR0_9NOCA|nr:hypothetical protein BOX37_13145 [Nocardia mangyaensis]
MAAAAAEQARREAQEASWISAWMAWFTVAAEHSVEFGHALAVVVAAFLPVLLAVLQAPCSPIVCRTTGAGPQ